jgi:ATP-binding cassette, subfamily F, member 3
MLNVANISKSYDDRELFSGVSFTVGMSDRIAIIGRNGSGKTTLFEIITGSIMPDAGSVSLRRGTAIGYLRQDVQGSSEQALLEYVSSSSDDVSDLAHKMQLVREELAEETDEETLAGLLKELGQLQDLYEAKGGYDSEHQAKMVLSGLGFAETDLGRALSEFSGGWRTRIELARLLFVSPDVLLLDEPTNYLDLETQRWFENYLKRYHGAVLLTSHDRAFLNNVVRRIIAIEDDGVILYRGSYDSYVLAREKDIEARQATARRQEREINRQMRFIERFRAKNTKASQVQSRIKQLQKVERVTVPRSTRKIRFNFPEPARSGRIVIELKHVTKAYGQNVVYRDLNVALERGDRVALVGINGAGKTTLLRMLAGVLPFEGGQRVVGHNVTIAYFAQYYIESLNPHNTVIDELRSVAPDESDQRLRGLLGAFLFAGDDVNKRISVLSGGEKTRVAIARMLTRPANFLLLDEPTNHLDIPSREILTDALDAYKGTMCFITHDRTLIRELANKIVEVRDGRARVFLGGYDDYLWQSTASHADRQIGATGSGHRATSRQPDRPSTLVDRRQRKTLEGELRNEHHRAISPLNQRIADVEREVDVTATRIRELENLIADPAHYEHPQNVVAVNREYAALKARLTELTAEWDGLTAEAERLKLEYRRALEDLAR